MGFPIRRSPDRSLFAAPRSLSQLITSFIGSWCQGIPLALFIAWPMKVFRLSQSTILEKSLSVLYYSWIMQAHMFEVYFRQNCILPNFFKNKFPFMLPSHNCIIIIDIQFSRCIFESLLQETQWSISFKVLQSISWWRLAGSNRWPPACKAGALPAELNPHIFLKWWAKMDSNHRPHDYQSCALASWAIGPYQLPLS